MRTTQQQLVLTMMVRDRVKIWWYAYDFIGNVGGLFVGHRAPARISELARDYPEMIETRPDGRLHMYRFRFENYDNFIKILPETLIDLIDFELGKQRRMGVENSLFG